MPTALLLIDVQESFRQRDYWASHPAESITRFLTHTNALLDGALVQQIPVVRVLHTDGPDTPDNPFAASSPHIRPLEGLRDFEPALTVVKHRHSALVGTGLGIWLHQNGINRLIIAGIRTEQCCETTTRHAADEGYRVDFVTDATLTFDMPTPTGDTFTAAEIVRRTETVLHGRFARLCTVDEALARASR